MPPRQAHPRPCAKRVSPSSRNHRHARQSTEIQHARPRTAKRHPTNPTNPPPGDQESRLTAPSGFNRKLKEMGRNGRFVDRVPLNDLAALYGEVVTFRERWVRGDEPGPERGMAALLGDRPIEPLGRRQWDMLARRADAVAERNAPGRARAR